MIFELMKANTPTESGLIYTQEALESIINNPITQARVREETLYVEYRDKSVAPHFGVDDDKIIGFVKNMYIEGESLIMEADITKDLTGIEYKIYPNSFGKIKDYDGVIKMIDVVLEGVIFRGVR